MAATRQKLTKDQRNSFIAAQLGWTMDAFDYFIVVLVYADIARTFHTSTTKVALSVRMSRSGRLAGRSRFSSTSCEACQKNM